MRYALLGLVALGAIACEDPARPAPDVGGATVFVDSDPRGGDILIDFVPTGETTPALIDDLEPGARNVRVELDTATFTYAFEELVIVADDSIESSVAKPLTIRCNSASCLQAASQFHAPANVRFHVSAAGPLFVFAGQDAGIMWPANTQNSYTPLGMATMTGTIGGDVVALGLRNVGAQPNYWAGRPVPTTQFGDPYRVTVPAWITPPTSSTQTTALRGVEVVQRLTVDATLPDVVTIEITWTNISADSLYRLLDPNAPAGGITVEDAWFGFILDADVGRFDESDDDLVSYDPLRNLVFAYDSDFEVSGFSGGWSERPGLIGLMMTGPVLGAVRLNAWPRERDFVAGAQDDDGSALLRAVQGDPPNHPDARIGFAPDDEADDYILSVATGGITFEPGDAVTLTFAVLLAAPVPGTFTSGVLLPAGDPLDGDRALAATAATLFEVADSVSDAPPLP